jgi:hypothetical protein
VTIGSDGKIDEIGTDAPIAPGKRFIEVEVVVLPTDKLRCGTLGPDDTGDGLLGSCGSPETGIEGIK